MARPEADASCTQSNDVSESDDPFLPAVDLLAFEGVSLTELRASSSLALGLAIDRVVADLGSTEEVTAGFNSAV